MVGREILKKNLKKVMCAFVNAMFFSKIFKGHCCTDYGTIKIN